MTKNQIKKELKRREKMDKFVAKEAARESMKASASVSPSSDKKKASKVAVVPSTLEPPVLPATKHGEKKSILRDLFGFTIIRIVKGNATLLPSIRRGIIVVRLVGAVRLLPTSISSGWRIVASWKLCDFHATAQCHGLFAFGTCADKHAARCFDSMVGGCYFLLLKAPNAWIFRAVEPWMRSCGHRHSGSIFVVCVTCECNRWWWRRKSGEKINSPVTTWGVRSLSKRFSMNSSVSNSLNSCTLRSGIFLIFDSCAIPSGLTCTSHSDLTL